MGGLSRVLRDLVAKSLHLAPDMQQKVRYHSLNKLSVVRYALSSGVGNGGVSSGRSGRTSGVRAGSSVASQKFGISSVNLVKVSSPSNLLIQGWGGMALESLDEPLMIPHSLGWREERPGQIDLGRQGLCRYRRSCLENCFCLC
jgi:hypothetical protein